MQLIHVACKNCGTFDIAGPGHPAVTFDEEKQQHVLTDRTALRHAHDDDCQPHPETGNYPLAFTFIGPLNVTGAS
jgi:hypothetical protein